MPPPDLPGLPRDAAGEPAFAEPWQARAFALAVLLHERGAFAWPDFAASLADALRRHPAAADYYHAWEEALERLLAQRNLAAPAGVEAMAATWRRAAANTPHGTPIRLENAGTEPGP